MLREYLTNNPDTLKVFKEAKFSEVPILIRFHDDRPKVLDGMHRLIASIREGKSTINAFVAKPAEGKKSIINCEPHVVYDLLKTYHMGVNKDKDALITALRYLRKSYSNVDYLLKERFGKSWTPSDEIQKIIQEALKD